MITPKAKTVTTDIKKPEVKTKTEIAKLTPKEKDNYDTSITVDNVLRGAGIRWEQAKADPIGTAQDLGLGVLNSFPALVSAIGDMVDVETGTSDTISKTLKGARTDQDSLGFDLAEATGLPAKTGLKALQKATKGTMLSKAVKTPTLGEALGKTAKTVKQLSPTNIANKIKAYNAVKVNKITKTRRANTIKDIREFIRNNTSSITSKELSRLQRKIKALTNAK